MILSLRIWIWFNMRFVHYDFNCKVWGMLKIISTYKLILLFFALYLESYKAYNYESHTQNPISFKQHFILFGLCMNNFNRRQGRKITKQQPLMKAVSMKSCINISRTTSSCFWKALQSFDFLDEFNASSFIRNENIWNCNRNKYPECI